MLPAGIHASHSVLPENVTEPKTRGICGHSSDQSLTLFDLPIASLKTSEGMFDWDCQKCLETSEDLAIELGRAYSQRVKSARRIEESESLSWGSPRVTTNGGAGKDRGDNRSRIKDQVHQWQTPSASAPDKEYTRDKGKKGSERLALSGQTLAWPTPTTRDHKDTGNLENVPTNSLLGRAVNDEKYWRTPGASDGEEGVMMMIPGKAGKYKLRDHVVNWATPTANQPGGTAEAFLERKRMSGKMGVSLTDLGMQVQAVDGQNRPDQINTNGKSRA
jgi:hypothetical protein